MRFTKMHGIGNDYIYVNLFEETVTNESDLAVRISNRHFGVGSDGLVLIAPSHRASFRMIMYNADGSRGDMCGNALRCVAKYVYDRRMTQDKSFTVETDDGIKTVRLHTDSHNFADLIEVDMGIPVTDCEKVPCLLGTGLVTKASITAGDRIFELTPVNTGNPHGVIILEEDVEHFDLSKYGSILESHPMFPRKANIEFINILDRTHIRMRVWERGSGITLACGTGSCAALVAAHLCGAADRDATIILDGGELHDCWRDDGHVFMTGPAAFVCNGEYLL